MIVSFRLGEIEACIDTEDTAFVPEVAHDLLARCRQTVHQEFTDLPDREPVAGDDGD